ncbi:MAG: hypothetical protein NVSMB64_29530 [Candidatus Velthaea sp.]
MRVRYVIALAILGAFFIASYVILHNAIVAQRSIARTVTVSGQQRMYSQRIAMFAEAIVARPDKGMRERARADLEQSIRTFAQQHRALTSGDASISPRGWPSASIRHMYFSGPFDVDRQVREYLKHAQNVEKRAQKGLHPGDSDLEYLLSVGPGPLLKSLDAIVQQYNLEQRTSVQTFEDLQLGMLMLGLSTLAIIWFTILLPLERDVASKTAALQLSATRDPLTSLLNRSVFTERVEQSIELAKRQRDVGAMLMIDLDRFKTVNDTYGHLIGDLALVRCAEILRANVRACDFVTRLGGDEFAVFAPAIDGARDLERFVERLCTALQYDVPTDTGNIRITASLGIAQFPADGETIDKLLHKSDRALYAAKASGRGTSRHYMVDALFV